MSNFQYMEYLQPYNQYPQHQYPQNTAPLYYPQPQPNQYYYHPQQLPPAPSQFPAGHAPVYSAPPAAHVVAPNQAAMARRMSRPISQPMNPSPPASNPDTDGNRSHCAFTFGWDFSQSEDDDVGQTPSPRSSHPEARYRQHEIPQNPRPNPAAQTYAGMERPTLVTQQLSTQQYPGMPRAPLTDHAYGVIMQKMGGGAPAPANQPHQLSDLHRRLFPPNCHISYQHESGR